MNYTELKQLLTLDEAIRPRRYKDSDGKVTAGIGCNLDAPGAEAMIKAVLPHINFHDLYNGLVSLSKDDMQNLLDYQIAVAVQDAKHLVPSFDAQPNEVQIAVTDMSFNMGMTKFSLFKKFLAAISREDYKGAIAELVNSAWFHEVPNRAKRDIALLSQIAGYRAFPAGGASGAPAKT